MIEVLLADDQALLRTGFRMVLESEPDIRVVGEAVDGADAVAQCRRLAPDLVVMDIRMPRLDGVEATRRIVADSSARVLVVTTFHLDDYVHGALRAGASGFLLKDAEPDEIVSAVRVVAGGDAVVAPAVTRRLLDAYAARLPAPVRDTVPAALSALTEREVEVLREVAGGRSNAEIAARLSLAETTVKTHVTHVLAKLGVRDRLQAVILAYDTGLVRPR